MKYTVMINHAEYAVGIYNTREEAEQGMIKCILDDEPHLKGKSDEDILDYDDEGYYRILEINNVKDEPRIKVGGKVRLIDGICVDRIYGGLTFSKYMGSLIGKDLTVMASSYDSEDNAINFGVKLCECPYGYWYSDAMLEVIE